MDYLNEKAWLELGNQIERGIKVDLFNYLVENGADELAIDESMLIRLDDGSCTSIGELVEIADFVRETREAQS